MAGVAQAQVMVQGSGDAAAGGRLFGWLGTASFGFASACAALLVLNLLDGLFTLTFLQLGVAEEANPLMRAAYEHSPLLFMGSKILLVNLGAWMLWANRRTEAARAALSAGVLLYAGIVAYHCSFLLTLAFAS